MKKLLMKRSEIRRAAVATLREKLAELQAISDRQEGRQEVYDTYVVISDEIERRKAAPGYVPLLVMRSSVYRMGNGELRERIAELEACVPPPDGMDAWRNTIALMRHELDRRKRHDKTWYWKRKLEDAACSTP